MKKFVAMMLTLIMVLSVASVAMATTAPENNFEPTAASTSPVTINGFEKKYTVTGASANTADTVYPKENLTFTSAADNANPDGGTANLTDVKFTNATTMQDSTTNGEGDYVLSFKHPAYTLPGLYHFELTEDDLKTQGVTYDTDKVYISVLVIVGEGNQLEVGGIGVTMKDDETTGMNQSEDNDKKAKKDDVIDNKLDLGKLTVKKNVTGNMGDSKAFFTITVKLKAEEGKTVRNKIVITATENESTTDKAVIDGTVEAWTGEKTVTLTIKNGGSVVFDDIPAGVTYTVEEDAQHIAAADKDVNESGDPTETDGAKGYHVTYANETGTIAKAETKEATVTNKKDVTIDTGVSIKVVPYVMILAVAMAGAAMMIIRRRKEDM